MLPGPADLGDRRGRRPGDRVVAAEDDRDRAGRGDLADLAVDQGVGAVDPGRDDVGVAGVDDRRGSRTARRPAGASGSSPTCTAPRGSPAGRSGRPGRWLTASSNGAPTIATSTLRARELGRVGDPGQLHERRQADVGRQVEVVVRLVRAVPAVARREVDVARVVGTLGHDGPPEAAGRRTARALGVRCRLSRRAAGSGPPSSGARRGMVPAVAGAGAGGRPRPRNSRQAASTSAGSQQQVERRLGDERRRQQRRPVGARAGGGVPELDRVAGGRARR